MINSGTARLVIDIGKTNVKIHALNEFDNHIISFNKKNKVVKDVLYDRVDVDGIWAWILKTIHTCASDFKISALVVTAHGATAALVNHSSSDNGLVLPIMDYEWSGLDSINSEYEKNRPAFNETFSPNLPTGLNLGRQLFWQQKYFSEEFNKSEALLMYPQYWSWLLTGKLTSEISSIGCHTDLWEPITKKFSNLVNSQNWNNLFPPFTKAWDVLGTVSDEIADITGLDKSCEVFTGVHDSNASYLRFMLSRQDDDFCIVSTGTWVVCMSSQESLECLDSSKDMLANINVEGRPVPCIRFMGGREYEEICRITGVENNHKVTEDDINQIINDQVMALPSFSQGNGPFGSYKPEIIGTPKNGAGLATIYCALMISFCLYELEAKGDVIIVGSFLKNPLLCQMVAQLCDDKDVYVSNDEAGTVKGAVHLTNWSKKVSLSLKKCESSNINNLKLYKSLWQKKIEGMK